LTLGKGSRPNQGNTDHLLKDSKASRTPISPTSERNAGVECHAQDDSSEQAKPRNDKTTNRERGKKGLKHLANPGRRSRPTCGAACGESRFATRKTRQKDHDPEHRNCACQQCTTDDLARITQVPGTRSTSSHSIVITSAPAMLTREIYFRVYDPHMPR
jgi:hypothetical protein